MALAATELDAERSDLLAMLAQHRQFLRHTTRGLTDDQARTRTTVSELTLGGLIKHVTDVERGWAQFIVEGPSALGDASAMTEADWAKRADEFRLLDGETLAGVLDAYEATAAVTDRAGLRAARSRCDPATAERPVVPALGAVVGAAGAAAHPRRDRPARRATPTSSASPSTVRRRWAERAAPARPRSR